MFSTPFSRRRSAPVRRSMLAVAAAFCMLLQQSVFTVTLAQTTRRVTAAPVTPPPPPPVPLNSTAQTIPFSQDWTNTGLITANDDWSNVPGIEGFFLNSTNSSTGIDPQTVLTDTFNGGTTTVDLDVIANQTSTAITNGGVAEFHTTSQAGAPGTNPTIGLQGSGTADAPFIRLYLNTTGKTGINVAYNLRDIDCTADDAVQPVALQFRVGNTGSYTNVPAGFVSDATTGPSICTAVTAVSATLPAAADNQALVQVRILTTNAAGNDEWVGIDDISVTTGVVSDAAPTVTSTTPANNATNVAVNADIMVTFSEPVNVSNSSFTISCGTSGTHTFALSGSGASYTLNPDTNFANNETCTVTVVANQVSDQDMVDPPDNMAMDFVFMFTTIVGAGACGDSFTPIYTIQGSGTASPVVGSTVSTEGVVVGDFQGSTNLSGFYIQDPTGDANTATSDGIFVFDGSTPAVNVAAGDRVRVNGAVSEAFNNTQITPNSVQICSTGNTLPAPTVYDLPEPVNNDLERVENMLVTFPETLTVTGNFTWGRFGELVLSADSRLYQQNSFDRPNTPGALARADLNNRAYVYLDDGMSVQNPNPIPYQSPDMTRRTGDTVTGLTGILTFDFSQYRVQPTAPVTFAQANPRPPAPASVGGNLKVAASNVLNYFNGDGMGGGFPTARGASTAAEFARQRAKIIAALVTLNADVIGISEMENDGFGPQSALQDLINGMNDATAPGTYAGIDSPNPGTDLIKNAIIYKPASVTLVGAQVNDINSAWDQARPPLAQTFQHNGNGEKFTYIVNHFTSKGCSANDTGIDADMGDGQGCDNGQRKIQANRLLVFIQDRKTASGDPDVLSMGDYNAYGEEDPLFILEQDSSDTLMDGAGGLFSESKRFIPMLDRYSFQFSNQFGELDHAFATKSMNDQVSGTTIWHINADEPVAIDYNTEFKTQDLYAPTPFRASDHDPLIVGLNLTATPLPAPGSLIISEYRLRGPNQEADEFIEFYNNTDSPINVQTADGSEGWALVSSDGQIRFVIATALIPARGHFLAAGPAYSLSSYPGGNNGTAARNSDGDEILLPGLGNAITYQNEIPDQSGIALFSTSNPANFDMAHRLDAVGYSTAPALYREGTGFQTTTPGTEIGGNIEYSFLRDLRAGTPKDTQDNAADFMAVETSGQNTSIGQNLGAPGPENLNSPIMRLAVNVDRLDKTVGTNVAPNRVRDMTPVTNGANGTISIRRNVINLTGQPVTRLRFRIKEITTFPSPTGTADVRALSSGDIQVMLTDGSTAMVQGTTLETPPAQPSGGGWNASWSPTGTINLASPLPAGQSINVQFLLGVQQNGTFRIFINVEALP